MAIQKHADFGECLSAAATRAMHAGRGKILESPLAAEVTIQNDYKADF